MTADPLILTLTGTRDADVIAQPDDLSAADHQDITIDQLGLSGNDTLTAYSGPSDWPGLATSPGDTLTIANHLFGGFGNDTFVSSIGLTGLTPDQTANYIHADTLDGWKGNDTYIVNDINVVISDSYGTNTLVITDHFMAVTGLTNISTHSFSPFYTNDIQNITLQGTADFDITGDGFANRLVGNDGRNMISGNGGEDTIIGGGGADTLIGASGNCLIFGGDGRDFMRGNGDQDTLFGGFGDDTLYGDSGNDMLYGGKGQDLLSGQDGDDFYLVNSTGDTVEEAANQGFDTVTSSNIALHASANVEALVLLGTANLALTGGGQVTQMTGNDGDNLLTTGNNAETLTGGAGADTFAFATVEGGDTITDFTAGTDRIDLSALMPGGGFVGDAALTGAGQVRYAADSGLLQGDVDGGGADWAITLSDGLVLTAADFIF